MAENEVCPECGDSEGSWSCREYDPDYDIYYYLCDNCRHAEWLTDNTETWKCLMKTEMPTDFLLK